jgi:hypothetical protein
MTRWIAAAVGILVVLGACSQPAERRDDESPEPAAMTADLDVPARPGYAVFRGVDYGFAFPATWRQLVGTGTFTDGAEIEVVGPEQSTNVPALISLYRAENFNGDFDDYVFEFNAAANLALPDRKVIRDEEAVVPHAEDARLIEVEYTLPRKAATHGAGGVPESFRRRPLMIRQVDLIVLTKYGVTINLRTAAPLQDFDPLLSVKFTSVIESLRLKAPANA